MKILLVGSGSREHALAWHFRREREIKQLFIAPGNAGTAALGVNLNISATNLTDLVAWARSERPDLTFVGPEAPLCLGIVDAFQDLGLNIFGPNKKAANLEASKIFTKELLLKYQIPTGLAQSFSISFEAYAYSRKQPFPQVIKADGLAAGKGVVIAQTQEQADQAIREMMELRVFGASGERILIEECLTGQEISILAITDGQTFKVLPTAQDHKRLLDLDEGPNTGGMGAYAPAPFYTPQLAATIDQTILIPTLAAFRAEGIDYQGILYVGIMLTVDGPKVLEFNVRLGDPETQVILPLLRTPLHEIARAVQTRSLHGLNLRYDPLYAVGVVLAAAHYPENPRAGDLIEGLDRIKDLPNTMVFHGGTAASNGQIVTSGGRVLTVTAWDANLQKARDRAYDAADRVHFPGVQFRKDIGARSLPSVGLHNKE